MWPSPLSLTLYSIFDIEVIMMEKLGTLLSFHINIDVKGNE